MDTRAGIPDPTDKCPSPLIRQLPTANVTAFQSILHYLISIASQNLFFEYKKLISFATDITLVVADRAGSLIRRDFSPLVLQLRKPLKS